MRIALRLGMTIAAATLLAGAALADPGTVPAGTPTGEALPVKNVSFSFEGPFGTYNQAALQRGYQVYKEVCSACHSMDLVTFQALTEPGGPHFTVAQAKALAASFQVPAAPNKQGQLFDENGERLKRPATLADHFPSPFPNAEAARFANGGALPPDMSDLAKAVRGGAARIYSIVTGFGMTPPPGFKVAEGKFFNPYFAGWNIGMPPPLVDGAVTYSDGTKATVDQEAHDVATFLMWAAEPKMDQRKQLGLEVLIFLVVLSGLLYLSYRRVWRDLH